jgi:hypothetical protein
MTIYNNYQASGLIAGDSPGTNASPAPVTEQIYDADNPPVGELGSSFNYDSTFGGWLDGDVYAPAEPSLQDYHHMLDTDGTAKSIELMLSYPLTAAPWSIEPAKGDTGQAEFIYDALTALPHQGGPLTTIEQLVQQMTSAFVNKRAYFEKVFKVNDDGKIVYHKLAFRPPETCELALDARTAEPRGFRQMPLIYPYTDSGSVSTFVSGEARPDVNAPVSMWVKVPSERAFVYIYGSWRDPLLGESAMKVPYHIYLTKRKIRWLWYQFLDQTALPKTIVRNQDEIQARNDARKVASLRGKSVLALGAETTVDPYESSGKGAQYFQEALKFCDDEMLNAGMMGFLGLTAKDATGKGSYAMATTMEQLYNRSRTMVALDMARCITNDVIGPLIAYNFGVKAPVPRFKFGPLTSENDQAALAAFQQIMAAPNATVPVEFYNELIGRVAGILNLDPGKVAKDIEVNGSPQATSLQQLQIAVQNSQQMLENAKKANAATPGMGPTGKPPSPSSPQAPTGGQQQGNGLPPRPQGSPTSVGARGAVVTGAPKRPSTAGTRPFGATSVANPARQSNKNYGK